MLFRALRTFFASLVLAAALILVGCASPGASPQTPVEITMERAQARWNALLKRDWPTAYGYLTSGYRATVSIDRYGGQFTGPLQWEGAKAQGAQCEPTRCVVTVELVFRLMLAGHRDRKSSTFIEEIWLLEDGQWYKFEQL
jgi:hypothetical protein